MTTIFVSLRTLLFGPVGNSKFVVLFIHVVSWFYEFPMFVFRGLPVTLEAHYHMSIFWIFSTILWWSMFYVVHFSEPGYLKQNTLEYKNALRKVEYLNFL
jgi:hypothetical protein